VGHQAQDVTVERQGGVEVGHRNANVGNTGCLGHMISGHETRQQHHSGGAGQKVIGAKARGQVSQGRETKHECN
jgi:hypothetical protein